MSTNEPVKHIIAAIRFALPTPMSMGKVFINKFLSPFISIISLMISRIKFNKKANPKRKIKIFFKRSGSSTNISNLNSAKNKIAIPNAVNSETNKFPIIGFALKSLE